MRMLSQAKSRLSRVGEGLAHEPHCLILTSPRPARSNEATSYPSIHQSLVWATWQGDCAGSNLLQMRQLKHSDAAHTE